MFPALSPLSQHSWPRPQERSPGKAREGPRLRAGNRRGRFDSFAWVRSEIWETACKEKEARKEIGAWRMRVMDKMVSVAPFEIILVCEPAIKPVLHSWREWCRHRMYFVLILLTDIEF